jgi:hypothetical protein
MPLTGEMLIGRTSVFGSRGEFRASNPRGYCSVRLKLTAASIISRHVLVAALVLLRAGRRRHAQRRARASSNLASAPKQTGHTS